MPKKIILNVGLFVLVLNLLIDFLMMSGLIYISTIGIENTSIGSLVFWHFLKVVQYSSWIFLLIKCRGGSSFLSSEGVIKPIFRNILVMSFSFDLIGVMITGGFTPGTADLGSLVIQFKEFYPMLGSAVESYLFISPTLSRVTVILNPIPFGMALFILPALMGLRPAS